MPPEVTPEARPFIRATVVAVPAEGIKILEVDSLNGAAAVAEETVSAEILALDPAAHRRADLVEDLVENASVLETRCSLAEASEEPVDSGVIRPARPPEQVVRLDLLVLPEQVILLLEMPEVAVAQAEQEQVVPAEQVELAVSVAEEGLAADVAQPLAAPVEPAGTVLSRSSRTSKEKWP